MTISSHQIHSVLRTYGKQLRRGQRLNRIKQVETQQPIDTIKISPEAKRKRVIEQVAVEILNRLADQGVRGEEVEKTIVGALSQEYGRPLTLRYDPAKGRFNFLVLDEDKPGGIKPLDEKETEGLNRRLVEITEEVVDRTML
ncbi:MAG: DVU0524 family FlgM-associated protein [Pseudomonadota bacterium]